jgi:methionyl-tRNA synthetase
MNKFYLTTPIYYINGLPHIGHVFTTVLADVIARYHRLFGEDVYFLSGTDEHGQKAEKAAKEAGITPQELADRIVPNFKNLWKKLNISNNDFIRTTESRHKRGVEEIFRRSHANGDIYLGTYEGWYCTFDENFLTEGQLIEGKCPDCNRAVERVQEESYFFRLSKYQEPLLNFYRENPNFVVPHSRFNEVISFVEGGLRDLSISRTKVKWGIPLPVDPKHTIYVWFDALCNYITALGFPEHDLYQRYWPANLHVIGKDIVRFHCVYWPAFLLSAGLPLPRQALVHGWWLKESEKISKSRGNVVDPDSLIGTFGVDPLRYFLIREAPVEGDSNYSFETILKRVNSDLANDLGNLVSRTLTMVTKYSDGKIPASNITPQFRGQLEEIVSRLPAYANEFSFSRLLGDIWNVVNSINRYIVEEQPWSLAKDPSKRERLESVLYNTSEGLRLIAGLIAPVVPDAADAIWQQLGLSHRASQAKLNDLQWGILPVGTKIKEVQAIFPRIEITEPPQNSSEKIVPQEITYSMIEDFQKMGLKVGEIKTAEKIPNSKKLLKLSVDLGSETRQLVAGIAEVYSPEELIGKQVIVVSNLKPTKIMGVESNGMILAASVEGRPTLAGITARVPNGTIVK